MPGDIWVVRTNDQGIWDRIEQAIRGKSKNVLVLIRIVFDCVLALWFLERTNWFYWNWPLWFCILPNIRSEVSSNWCRWSVVAVLCYVYFLSYSPCWVLKWYFCSFRSIGGLGKDIFMLRKNMLRYTGYRIYRYYEDI